VIDSLIDGFNIAFYSAENDSDGDDDDDEDEEEEEKVRSDAISFHY
jgi:hypothetical protein